MRVGVALTQIFALQKCSAGAARLRAGASSCRRHASSMMAQSTAMAVSAAASKQTWEPAAPALNAE